MATNAEIARDLLIASISRASGSHNGDWIAQQYAVVLEGVGTAVRKEEEKAREDGKKQGFGS